MTADLSLSGLLEVLSFSSLLTGFGFAVTGAVVLSVDPLFARAFTATAGILALLATGMYRLAFRSPG